MRSLRLEQVLPAQQVRQQRSGLGGKLVVIGVAHDCFRGLLLLAAQPFRGGSGRGPVLLVLR